MVLNYLFPAQKNGKCFYIDINGQIINEMPYKRCGMFSGDFASVFDGKNIGFIDKKLELVIPCKYEDANIFSENVCAVKIGSKWGLINNKDNLVIQPKYAKMGKCSFGIIGAEIERGGTLLYIDLNDNVVIPDNGARAMSAFSEGLIASRDDSLNLHGYRNEKGEWAIKPLYNSGAEFSCGLAGVTRYIQKRDLTGFIDGNGNEVLPFIYSTTIAQFKCDLAVASKRVKNEDLFGAINKKGEWIIDPKWNYLQDFSDDFAMFRSSTNGRAGFLDARGNIVISERYKNVQMPFKNGIARVQDEKGWLFINKKGDEIWRFE